MGFDAKPRLGALPPPPPDDSVKEKLALRDRFGLPVFPLDVLTEDAEERRARIANVLELVGDTWNTAVANLGRRTARSLFERTVKNRSTGNRRADAKRRSEALRKWDEEADKTPGSTRSIATRLGRKQHPHDPLRAESEARYIRQAVRQRAREQKLAEDKAQAFEPGLLARISTGTMGLACQREQSLGNITPREARGPGRGRVSR